MGRLHHGSLLNQVSRKSMIEALRPVLKRQHSQLEVMLVCVRRYAAHPLSLRHIEETMAEHGVVVDHTTPRCIAA
jgi:putative transposase